MQLPRNRVVRSVLVGVSALPVTFLSACTGSSGSATEPADTSTSVPDTTTSTTGSSATSGTSVTMPPVPTYGQSCDIKESFSAGIDQSLANDSQFDIDDLETRAVAPLHPGRGESFEQFAADRFLVYGTVASHELSNTGLEITVVGRGAAVPVIMPVFLEATDEGIRIAKPSNVRIPKLGDEVLILGYELPTANEILADPDGIVINKNGKALVPDFSPLSWLEGEHIRTIYNEIDNIPPSGILPVVPGQLAGIAGLMGCPDLPGNVITEYKEDVPGLNPVDPILASSRSVADNFSISL